MSYVSRVSLSKIFSYDERGLGLLRTGDLVLVCRFNKFTWLEVEFSTSSFCACVELNSNRSYIIQKDDIILLVDKKFHFIKKLLSEQPWFY